MNYKRMMFFLDEKEQYELLRSIEEKNSIYYVKCGSYDINKIQKFSSIDEFISLISPDIGEHYYSSWLILLKDMNAAAEQIMISGEEKVTVYPLHGNENAIVYNPGGIYQRNNIIHGEFSVVSNNPIMSDVFKQIQTELKRISIKKNSYFIGKETYNNIDRYKRLITISVRSPDTFDFTL